MGLVLFFLAMNGALIGGYVHGRLLRARQQDPPPLPKRLTNRELASFGARQLMIVLVLGVGHALGSWSLQSVGFYSASHWLFSVLAGELAFIGLALTHFVVLWALRKYSFMRAAATKVNLRIWPRGRAQKWFAALFIMVFNPFTEELVMRGILIHHWGLLLGSPVVPIVVGLFLNAGLHWYQGWRMQLWHAMVFAVIVTLLYSPYGLIAAITAHVFGDVMPIVHLRRQQKAVRRARHAAMRARRCATQSTPSTAKL